MLEGCHFPVSVYVAASASAMNTTLRPTGHYLKKVFQHTRSILAISPAKAEKRLPELLTDHELVGFYEAVWHARNPTHMIMVKLLIFTGLRNAELARVRLQDMDLDHCQVHVVQGKGSKDRSVLFPSSFRRELGSISMDRGSAAPCSYSNRTGCGRTPLVASGRSSINTPQPLGSRNGSTRIYFGIRSSLF
jgi:integrase